MRTATWIALGVAVMSVTACDKGQEEVARKPAGEAPAPAAPAAKPAAPVVDRAQLAIFQPLPETMATTAPDPRMVDLGRMLYYDTRLSKNQDISCNSCHKLDRYGVDGEPTSPGHKGQRGDRNSPTSYNAAGHFVQFWDGRAADVEAQAMGPVTNPVEMALPDEAAASQVLASIPEYQKRFAELFPGEKAPATLKNAAIAIGAFERGLTTPSRWDSYLKGDESALSDQEKRGLVTYLQTGCQTCHNGAYMGGNLYQKLGLVNPWPDETDPGRMKATANEADKLFFKVPSLRNVTETGPWFHNGKVASIEEAVRLMAWHQLGKKLDEDQVQDLVAFLRATKGEIPTAYVAQPELPPSGPKTPKPDPS